MEIKYLNSLREIIYSMKLNKKKLNSLYTLNRDSKNKFNKKVKKKFNKKMKKKSNKNVKKKRIIIKYCTHQNLIRHKFKELNLLNTFIIKR